jgi:hypothetical protein
MWHQYGLVETDPKKGIFMKLGRVPPSFNINVLGGSPELTGSLLDVCGFTAETKRLGVIAEQTEVREAIVAVPFIEEEGSRKYFKISRDDIDNAMDEERQVLVGESVKAMIEKMKRYVFPPSMDFLKTRDIDPFAMYIFEFKHVFTRQDLADLWQGLLPESAKTMEEVETSISHNLLAKELLGGGSVLLQEPDKTVLATNERGVQMPDKLKWMVFKVKQRAKTNYYDQIISRQVDLPSYIEDSEGEKVQISYNWPYDYFSLVELAKIEAEVSLGAFAEEPERQVITPIVQEEPTPMAQAKAAAADVLTEAALTNITQATAGTTFFSKALETDDSETNE